VNSIAEAPKKGPRSGNILKLPAEMEPQKTKRINAGIKQNAVFIADILPATPANEASCLHTGKRNDISGG
jgi:mannose/fructose-specific phosphotransferase system component IIA